MNKPTVTTCKKCFHCYSGQKKCPVCHGIEDGKKVHVTRAPVDHIDKKVGAILRARRIEVGMTQEAVAKAVGVTFQQVQKYEKGANSMNSGRLVDFSKALNMPVARFFGEQPYVSNNASDREGLEMMKAFNAIPDAAIRKRISDLARAVGGMS